MATRVDIEQIETTKSEKLLALILAVFFLIGGLWTYQKIDDYVREAVGIEEFQLQFDDPAVSEFEAARTSFADASSERRAARENLELRREAYRTALDAGKPAGQLERAYADAQERFDAARLEASEARAELRAAEFELREAERRAQTQFEERDDRRALYSFLARLVFVVALLALGYWLLARLRARNSRYLLVAFALLGATTVLAFVFAGDYITDYVDPLDLGPLILSLFGIATTLAAFWALQRYLAKRMPFRRVRKRECPFCGYPVGVNEHCEGCGREVIAPCSTCGETRRVGTLHCGACGHA